MDSLSPDDGPSLAFATPEATSTHSVTTPSGAIAGVPRSWTCWSGGSRPIAA